MFRQLAILLLSTILGSFARGSFDDSQESNFWPLIKPARWKIEELIRKEFGIPSAFEQYGRDELSRYSAENENDGDDDAFIENCYDSQPRFGSSKPFPPGLTPRVAKSSMLRSARDPRRDPRQDPRLRSVWIPVSLPGSYSKDTKYPWDLKQDHRLNEGYVRPASDALEMPEPVIIRDYINQADRESNRETRLPWSSEKTRDEQLYNPLDLSRPKPGKSHNENVNINTNSNVGRRLNRPPQARRRSMRRY